MVICRKDRERTYSRRRSRRLILDQDMAVFEQPESAVMELIGLLHPTEVDALKQRISWLVDTREFPGTSRRRH